MKTAIYILIFLFTTFSVSAQNIQYKSYQGLVNNLHTYGGATNFPTSELAEDFGPRSYQYQDAQGTTHYVTYNFHGGLDYNAPGLSTIPNDDDNGDIILAVNTGDLHWAGVNRTGLKWIVITSVLNAGTSNQATHNLCFEHISQNGNIATGQGLLTGGCRVKMMDAPNADKWAIIFYENGNYSAVGPPVINGNVTFVDETNTSRTIGVSSHILQGGNVAPLGGSGVTGAGNPYPPHAHTQGMINITTNTNPPQPILPDTDDNSKNPLQYITHPVPTYDFEISQQNISNNAISPVYPGSNVTPLRARILLHGENPTSSRYSSVMDIERIEFKLRDHLESTWKTIKGLSFDRIQFGGRLGNLHIPSNIHTSVGTWTHTGMAPRAYFYNNYDDFYFIDFYARIHKNDPMSSAPDLFASYPWYSRFPDGDYEVKCALTRVQDEFPMVWSPPGLNIKIDNFKPFIYGAEVYFSNGPVIGGVAKPVYKRYWSEYGGDGTILLELLNTAGVTMPTTATNITISIYALASEAMATITAKIPALSPTGVLGAIDNTYISTDGRRKYKFQFTVSSSNININNNYQIEFEGTDVSGNGLLPYQVGPGCSSPMLKEKLPYRAGANSWSDGSATTSQGVDKVHFFIAKGCGQRSDAAPGCIDAEEVVVDVNFATASQSDGSISINLTGSHPNIGFTWMDKGGSIISTDQTLENIPAGTYCLNINEDCCTVCGCFEVKECETKVVPIRIHPTSVNSNDGSIIITMPGGEEPFTYQWANGQTTSQLTGLSTGTYCVTVTDKNGCQGTACPALIICPDITVSPSLVKTIPSSCTAQDGQVKVNSYGISSNDPIPALYDFVLLSESGQEFTEQSGGKYVGLSSGTYTIIVTNQSTQCTGSYTFDLLAYNYPEDILVDISPACAETPNGRISLGIGGPGTFTFDWDNLEGGVEMQDGYISDVSQIYEGTYCVTISSDAGGCVIEKCYDVPGLAPASPLSVSAAVEHPCPEQHTGAIDLTVTGGLPPFTFDWEDVTPFYEETAHRSGLAAGDYSVTVTDYCGESMIYAITLSPLTLTNINFNSGCQEQGLLGVSVVNGNLPYTYIWSNGATEQNLEGVESGQYCVTVTDSEGCTLRPCIRGRNREFEIDVTEPCEGIAEGVIKIKIFNPGGGYIHVAMNGTDIYENVTTDPLVDFEIPSLSGGQTYVFDIDIQGCVYSGIAVDLGFQQVAHLFDYYDGEHCYWNDACNGVIIPGSTIITNPIYDIFNGEGGLFTKCQVPVKCGRQVVDHKKINKRWVRAAEYYSLLEYAEQTGGIFDYDYIQFLKQSYVLNGFRPCDRVYFCPASLSISSSIGALFSGDPVQIPGTTCYALTCGILSTNHTYCLDQLIPQTFGSVINTPNVSPDDPIFQCDPATQNLYQLTFWYNGMIAQYGSLFNNPSPNGLKTFIDLYGNTSEAKCIKVTFCQSDFSVLSSNVSEVDCGNPPFNCETPQPDPFSPCLPYACIDDIYYADEPWTFALDGNQIVEFFGHWEFVCTSDFPGDFLIAPNDTAGVINKISSYPMEQSQFINLGKAVSEGECMPKGIVKTGTQFQYIDFAVNAKADVLQHIPNIISFVDEWDLNAITYVREAGTNQFAVEQFLNDEYVWSDLLQSATHLSVEYFEPQAENYVIGGEFIGTLLFNQMILGTENDKSGFLVTISASGSLVDSKIVSNIGTNGKLCFGKNQDVITIAGFAPVSTVKVNGEIKTVDSQSVVKISIDQVGSDDTKSVFFMDSTLSILKILSSEDGSFTTYILQGTGNYTVGTSSFFMPGTQSLEVLTMNNSTEELAWQKRINHGGTVTTHNFDALYGFKNNLIIGLTYEDAVSIDEYVIPGIGTQDITFLNFSEFGEIIGSASYGTEDPEMISKLMKCGEIVYFGGEFSGPANRRLIGRYDFWATNTPSVNPFISLVEWKDINEKKTGVSLRKSLPTGKTVYNTMVKIYPNPADDQIIVQVDSPVSGKVSVQLLDALGKNIRQVDMSVEAGQNKLQINDLNKLTSGIYFIQITDAEGNKWNQRIVKS